MLVRLLTNYDVAFNFISTPQLSLDKGTRDFLEERNIRCNYYDSISAVIETTDFLYMTRIQKERLNGQKIEKRN